MTNNIKTVTVKLTQEEIRLAKTALDMLREHHDCSLCGKTTNLKGATVKA
jgi:hypothetical protein